MVGVQARSGVRYSRQSRWLHWDARTILGPMRQFIAFNYYPLKSHLVVQKPDKHTSPASNQFKGRAHLHPSVPTMLQTLVLARRDVAVLIAIVLGTVLLRAFYRLFFHSLAQIPGPRLARVTQAWLTKQYMSGNWHDTYLELHQKYGSIVRIAPNEVSFVDAETLKKLYSYSRAAPKAFQISPRSIFLSDIIRRRGSIILGLCLESKYPFSQKQTIKNAHDDDVRLPQLTI
jgi:hypothetical protein